MTTPKTLLELAGRKPVPPKLGDSILILIDILLLILLLLLLLSPKLKLLIHITV